MTLRACGPSVRSDWQADLAHDLVCQGLPLGIPQREQVTDITDDAVHDVGELTHDGQPETDWLAGLLAHHLELHDRLADAGAASALAVAVVPDEVGDRQYPHHDHRQLA